MRLKKNITSVLTLLSIFGFLGTASAQETTPQSECFDILKENITEIGIFSEAEKESAKKLIRILNPHFPGIIRIFLLLG